MRYAFLRVSSADASAFFAHRFLLFTGKGGVGKTTVVAALAVHAAALGLRPLVVELGHRESMRSVFGVDDVGFDPRDVGHGVHAMSMDIDLAVLDYLSQHVPSRRVARSIAQNKVIERLFKAMPAVGEIATLNKLRRLELERDGAKSKWHPIIIDLDATGHAMMFLELRNVIAGLMGSGPMLRLIEGMADMFADPHTTRLNLVATPEELPVTETIELHHHLQAAKTVAFGRVYVNRVPRPPLPLDAAAKLDDLEQAARAVSDRDTLSDVEFGRRALEETRRAREQIERLTEHVPLPVIELPRLSARRMGPSELASLGALAASGSPNLKPERNPKATGGRR